MEDRIGLGIGIGTRSELARTCRSDHIPSLPLTNSRRTFQTHTRAHRSHLDLLFPLIIFLPFLILLLPTYWVLSLYFFSLVSLFAPICLFYLDSALLFVCLFVHSTFSLFWLRCLIPVCALLLPSPAIYIYAYIRRVRYTQHVRLPPPPLSSPPCLTLQLAFGCRPISLPLRCA